MFMEASPLFGAGEELTDTPQFTAPWYAWKLCRALPVCEVCPAVSV